jgi:hypothetical protein
MLSIISQRRLPVLLAALFVPSLLPAQSTPWMRSSLSADRRAALLIGAMTLDEKMQQLVGAEAAPHPRRRLRRQHGRNEERGEQERQAPLGDGR